MNATPDPVGISIDPERLAVLRAALRHEGSRLAFLEARDGLSGARDFALRTLAIYRAALAPARDERGGVSKRVRGYGVAYRPSLVASCLDFRSYLRNQDAPRVTHRDASPATSPAASSAASVPADTATTP